MLRSTISSKTTEVINTISDLLTDICTQSKAETPPNVTSTIKPFLSKKIPKIAIKDFLERLVKYSKIEPNTIISIFIYIDRACDTNKIRWNYYNIHKLIIAAMLAAIKYFEDDYFDNSYYAKVGGVTLQEINKLEYSFLALLDFSLFIDKGIFEKYDESWTCVMDVQASESTRQERETCVDARENICE